MRERWRMRRYNYIFCLFWFPLIGLNSLLVHPFFRARSTIRRNLRNQNFDWMNQQEKHLRRECFVSLQNIKCDYSSIDTFRNSQRSRVEEEGGNEGMCSRLSKSRGVRQKQNSFFNSNHQRENILKRNIN